jgi:hypothetical protein
MGRPRFRSKRELVAWAGGLAARIAREPGNGTLLVDRLVDTLWRDGYACGAADARQRAAEALGLAAELELEHIEVEPLNGVERMSRRRRRGP